MDKPTFHLSRHLEMKVPSLSNYLIPTKRGPSIPVEELDDPEVLDVCKAWTEAFKKHVELRGARLKDTDRSAARP